MEEKIHKKVVDNMSIDNSSISPTLEIHIDNIKLVSVNNMYNISKHRSKKYRFTITSVRRSNEFTILDDMVSDLLDQTIDDKSLQNFKDYLNADDQRAICMTFIFYVPRRSFFQSDTSNFPKALEDIIKFKLNVDDCRNTKIIAEKHLSSDKNWHTYILLEIYNLPYEVPKDKWPDHILGKLPNNRQLIDNVVIRLTKEEVSNHRYKPSKKHPVFTLDEQQDGTTKLLDPSEETGKTKSSKSSKSSKKTSSKSIESTDDTKSSKRGRKSKKADETIDPSQSTNASDNSIDSDTPTSVNDATTKTSKQSKKSSTSDKATNEQIDQSTTKRKRSRKTKTDNDKTCFIK